MELLLVYVVTGVLLVGGGAWVAVKFADVVSTAVLTAWDRFKAALSKEPQPLPRRERQDRTPTAVSSGTGHATGHGGGHGRGHGHVDTGRGTGHVDTRSGGHVQVSTPDIDRTRRGAVVIDGGHRTGHAAGYVTGVSARTGVETGRGFSSGVRRGWTARDNLTVASDPANPGPAPDATPAPTSEPRPVPDTPAPAAGEPARAEPETAPEPDTTRRKGRRHEKWWTEKPDTTPPPPLARTRPALEVHPVTTASLPTEINDHETLKTALKSLEAVLSELGGNANQVLGYGARLPETVQSSGQFGPRTVQALQPLAEQMTQAQQAVQAALEQIAAAVQQTIAAQGS